MIASQIGMVILWSLGPPMPQPKSCRVTALVDGRFVTVGGTWWETTPGAKKPDVKHWIRDAWAYDPKAGKWSGLPDYPRPIGYGSAVAVDRTLYVIGGCDGKEAFAGCYRMDLGADAPAWEKFAALPRKLCLGSATVIGKTIYITAGQTESPSHTGKKQVVDEVFACDVAPGPRAKWEKVTTLPSPRVGSAVVACGGKIHVLGGMAGEGKDTRFLDEVIRYDPATRRWSKCKPLPKPAPAPACVAVKDRYLLIVPGYVETPAAPGVASRPVRRFTPETWVYDVGSDSYKPGEPLKCAVYGCGIATDGSAVYVNGGEDTPDRTRVNLLQIGRLK